MVCRAIWSKAKENNHTESSDSEMSKFEMFESSAKTAWTMSDAEIAAIAAIMAKGFGGSPSGIPAGFTYIGQMIAHDIVQDSGPNRRIATPFLNLDSIYPEDGSALFNEIIDGNGKFVIDDVKGGKKRHDLLRIKSGKHKGKAIIPEQRNDENVIVSQLHVLWQKFHNKSIDRIEGITKHVGAQNYIYAKNFTILTFQQIVVQQYLKIILHPRVYEYCFVERKSVLMAPGTLTQTRSVPVEFSHAAFRFGHSMVRNKYVLHASGGGGASLTDLFSARTPLKKNKTIEWALFFDNRYGKISRPGFFNQATQINLEIAKGLHFPSVVPFGLDSTITSDHAELEIAKRIVTSDLKASQNLATGGDIIRHLYKKYKSYYSYSLAIPVPSEYIAALSFDSSILAGALTSAGAINLSIEDSSLWLFGLREAELYPKTDSSFDTKRLGAVTSSIIGEVLLSSIREADINIYQSFNVIRDHIGPLNDEYYQQLSGEQRLQMWKVLEFINS